MALIQLGDASFDAQSQSLSLSLAVSLSLSVSLFSVCQKTHKTPQNTPSIVAGDFRLYVGRRLQGARHTRLHQKNNSLESPNSYIKPKNAPGATRLLSTLP